MNSLYSYLFMILSDVLLFITVYVYYYREDIPTLLHSVSLLSSAIILIVIAIILKMYPSIIINSTTVILITLNMFMYDISIENRVNGKRRMKKKSRSK